MNPNKEICSVWVFASSSGGGPYQTIRYRDCSTSCNCRGWTFKTKVTAGGNRSCKHTRLVDLGIADREALSFKHYNTEPKPAESRSRNKVQLKPVSAAARGFDFSQD